MTAKVILNPYANRWNAEKRWPEAADALREAGVDFDLVVSERPCHIIELAEKAARGGFTPIIAAGGDGTIGEAVNGLARAAQSEDAIIGPLGVLPLGSANDFVFNMKLPGDLRGAARVIAAGKTRRIDVGWVNDLYFVNNSATGLEPYVTLKERQIKGLRGPLRYIVAALRGIADNPQWKARIVWDGGEYEGPVLLVTVGNCARTGGFYMAPHADPFDGKLTFVYGYRRTRGEILRLLPRTMKPGPGNYVEMEGIHEQNAAWLEIHMDRPAPAHIDGEIFSTEVQDLKYRIFPDRLQVLLP
jgi:YegS/Rv2252/BmrU family lipid kinase